MSGRRRAGRIVLALTVGDPSGIGPEVVAEALATRDLWRGTVPLVFGSTEVLSRAARVRYRRLPKLLTCDRGRPSAPSVAPVEANVVPAPGQPVPEGARMQLESIAKACDAVTRGDADALCTGPVSKAQIASTGLRFVGHTEYLAERFGARVLMMLAGPRLRVAVATTHLALARVPGTLSTRSLVEDLNLLDRELRARFGLKRPRIAVTGLNPHAGEGGEFGREEIEVISPAVAEARKSGVLAEGPFSADGLFPRAIRGAFDAVLAMYHDQGLIPVKLAHFDSAVNVTLGLPFVRTSPDHGVAYDIAGTGRADPRSMIAAIRMAIGLARGRLSGASPS